MTVKARGIRVSSFLSFKGFGLALTVAVIVIAARGWMLFPETGVFDLRVTIQSSTGGTVQVYYDTGSGFSETESVRNTIPEDRVRHSYSFSLPKKPVQQLRFDPLMSAGEVIIYKMEFTNGFGDVLRPIGLGLLKPENQIEAFNSFPSEIRVRIADGANDPQIAIPLDPPFNPADTGFFLRYGKFALRVLSEGGAVFMVLAGLTVLYRRTKSSLVPVLSAPGIPYAFLFALYTAQAFAVIGIAFSSLRLFSYDLRVPFAYGGDSLVILMFIKGMLLNGWTFDIPQLSAPYGMSAAAFPVMTNFDWLIMKGISVFTSEPGLVLNLFWLMTLVFSAYAAMACMRLLGIGRLYSFAAGILYAYLPFALMRNVGHLNLVYYLVPFLALLSINLASGLQLANNQQIRRITYLACVAQGFNYIYFSFFAVVLFIFAVFIGYINKRSRSVIRVAAIAIGLVVSATIINLSPSFYSWYKHGKPPEMEYKYPAEAEIFGAKIRKMIAPHQYNVLPVLHTWGKRDVAAHYPNENENVTVRLGFAGSVGFMLLLLFSLRAMRPAEEIKTPLIALAALSLFTLLMITVGGFGAVFNLLTVPDIRTYNRFSVFIAFFALAGLGIYLRAWYSTVFSSRMRWAIIVGVAILISISLYDQLLDREALVASQENDISRYNEDKDISARIKSLYPYGAIAILQLPMTGFPPHSVHEKMVSYDHLRPFLWTDGSIRWSWPSFSQRHRAWQDRISGLEGKELLRAATYSGFGAIWIDRFAYKDQGDKLISGLISAGGQSVFANARYIVLDLHQAAEKLKRDAGSGEFWQSSDHWLNSVVLDWHKGFYGEEVNQHGMHFRWSNNQSVVVLQNYAEQKRQIEFSFDLASEGIGDVLVTADKRQWTLKTRTQPTHYKLEVDIDARSKSAIKFVTGISKVNVASERGDLYFYLANPVVVDR